MNYIKKINSLKTGLKGEFSKTVGEADIVFFAGMTGNFDLSMVNEDFCNKISLGSRIINPSLISGLILTASQIVVGSGYICQAQNTEFIMPIHLGDTIKAEAEIIETNEQEKTVTFTTRCFNDKKTLIAKGKLKLSQI